MGELRKHLDHLQEQHDRHMTLAYDKLADLATPEELSTMWAYGAGLQHAIRTIEDAIRNGNINE